VQQIDGVLAIHDHESLEAKALKEFGLHLWSCSGHGNDSLLANSLHGLLELLNLDLCLLLFGVNLEQSLLLELGELLEHPLSLEVKFHFALVGDSLHLVLSLGN